MNREPRKIDKLLLYLLAEYKITASNSEYTDFLRL